METETQQRANAVLKRELDIAYDEIARMNSVIVEQERKLKVHSDVAALERKTSHCCEEVGVMNHHRDIDELERLIEGDPVKNHERIMKMMRPTLPNVIHKEFVGRQPVLVDDTNGNDQLPMSADEMIDATAAVLAEMSNNLRTEFEGMTADAIGPLTEQVATLQGQMLVLLNMVNAIVGNNNNGNGKSSKSIEAETRTTRRVRVRRSESTT